MTLADPQADMGLSSALRSFCSFCRTPAHNSLFQSDIVVRAQGWLSYDLHQLLDRPHYLYVGSNGKNTTFPVMFNMKYFIFILVLIENTMFRVQLKDKSLALFPCLCCKPIVILINYTAGDSLNI